MSADKPLIGVNSDPERWVGLLCINLNYSYNRSEGLLCAGWPHADGSSQSEVLDKFFKGEFK